MRQKIISLCCLMLISLSTFAQQRTVTGTVRGTDGEPLIGVVVQIEGKPAAGVITDYDGIYSIRVAPSDKKLDFSYIGMQNKSVSIPSGSTLNVEMSEESFGLEEVVVIGYGAVRKKELTGAVVQVKSEDIANVVTSDLGSALQGKISGVNIVASSGAPGASSEILIRGVASVNGSNTPLYVVDGVPQEGDPRISTNEIETIDVLKDAASCAIYGTRGAAGVILITTKSGKGAGLKISFDATYGIRNITSSMNLMDTSEQCYFELVQGRNTDGTLDDEYTIDPMKTDYGVQNDTDLLSKVFQDNAATQNYSLNISGGDQKASYNIVAGYYDEAGLMLNSDFQRFNTRANLNYQNNKWRISSSIGLTSEEQDNSSTSSIVYLLTYRPYKDDIDAGDTSDVETTSDANITYTNWVLQSFNTEDHDSTVKTLANINLNYDIFSFLTLGATGGMSMSNRYSKIFKPLQNVYSTDGTSLSDETDSYVQNESTRSTSYTFDTSIAYKQKFGDHNLGATAVLSLEEYNYEGFYSKRYGVANNAVSTLSGAVGDQTATAYTGYTNTLVGLIARVQYDWKGRYLFSANIRRDGSSKFAPENRWGTFPSVSAGWNIADEPFWDSMEDIVNNFKLRASYGTTGNQGFSAYSYTSTVTTGYDYLFGSDSAGTQYYGTTQTGYSNPEVQWETSIQSNLGVDLYFLNNKFTLTAEVYKTTKEDMLFGVTLPTSTGTSSSVTLNVGNMENYGTELAVGYNERIGDLSIGVTGTFSTNKNTVTDTGDLEGIVLASDGVLIWGASSYSYCTGIAEGYPAGSFFLYSTDGIVDTAEKLADYQEIAPSAKLGDLIYVDSNNDGSITEDDRTYQGSSLADYELGLNLNLGYKGIDLSMSWYSSIGHNIMNGSKAMAYTYGRAEDLIYAWSESNPVTSIPAYRGDLKDHDNYAGDTDLWLEDGTYLRLKNITLGYTLPKKFTQKASISSLRFYVTAQNPLTFTNYSGYDPEVGGSITSRGLDRGNYPVSSLYMAGVNINF